MQLADGTLESLNAAPNFGCESHLFAKDLREATLAPANLARGFAHAGDAGIMREVAESKLNLRRTLPPFESRCKSCCEEMLQALQAGMRRFDFAQAIAQGLRVARPDRVQFIKRNRPVAEMVSCIGCERRESSGREDDADEIRHIAGVDDFVNGARPDDESRGPAHVGAAFGAIEHVVASEIDDHLGAAGRQDALTFVGGMIHAGIPQRADERRKRGGGDALQEDHVTSDGTERQRGAAEWSRSRYSTTNEPQGIRGDSVGGFGYAVLMGLPLGDTQLVQIVDVALAGAAQRAGAWLACRPGCTQCCHGAFAINALDVAQLQAGMRALHAANPRKAEAIEHRAKAWMTEFGREFPGDAKTGLLGTSDEERARFAEFANEAACPALDPETGLCDVYEWRPMTCRVFGPPIRVEADTVEGAALGCCELCFVGASEEEIAACEMPVPHELEARLVEEVGGAGETVVAFALLP